MPAMAFFGGLGDLMATTAMGDWDSADEICVAVALDGWKPTRDTRLTGQRNPGRRLVFSKGQLTLDDPARGRRWTFPDPFGEQEVVAMPLAGDHHHLTPHQNTGNPRADEPCSADGPA